jgi:membrane protein
MRGYRSALSLLNATFARWNSHNAPRLGAALAYYTLLSVAPFLVLIVFICGLVLDPNTAERSLIAEVGSVMGYSTATTLKNVIDNAHHVGSGVVATAIALATLLFGASGVFAELRDSLNTIWDASPPPSTGWKGMVRQRLIAFGMVLGLGILLLGSLLLSAGITVVERFFGEWVPLSVAAWSETANFLLTLLGIWVLFGLAFKFVPEVPLRWRDVAVGAFFTAVLFAIGKALLGIYLGTAAVGSTYGAAGSVVAFVVWVYYSAQIFFFGAIFTRVYAERVTGAAVPLSRPKFWLGRRGASA